MVGPSPLTRKQFWVLPARRGFLRFRWSLVLPSGEAAFPPGGLGSRGLGRWWRRLVETAWSPVALAGASASSTGLQTPPLIAGQGPRQFFFFK